MMTSSSVRTAADIAVQAQYPLADLTTFRVGGPAEWFAAPRTFAQLQASVQWAQAEAIPMTFIGAGSNLLISDQGLPGLVICLRYLRECSFDDEQGQLTAAAGAPVATLAWKAAKRGWRGLEWTVGIPGTVGGAVVMNAGAHGSDTAEMLISAEVMSPDGTLSTWLPADLHYQYRHSALQGTQNLVTRATFQLKPGYNPHQVKADTSADLEQRKATQPYHLPNCGSVFRNPKPHSAGNLIERCGLKGYQIGQAQVSELHANFILNLGGATATDILRLIRHVQATVEAEWQVSLHPEVKVLGVFPNA
jgi:UDP-N-acetylmuramate dehydrogenase